MSDDEVADRVQGLLPDAIKEQFMCVVCYDFMEFPVQLSCCGWHICNKHNAQVNAAAANICVMAHKTPGDPQHHWGSLVRPNPSFKRLYEAITVRCKHQGCDKVLGVTELFEHEQNQCPKRNVKCEDCNKEVFFDGMDEHLVDLDACQPKKCICVTTTVWGPPRRGGSTSLPILLQQPSIKRHMKKCIYYQFTCQDCGERAQCWRWHKAVCVKKGGTKMPIEVVDDNTPKKKKTKRAAAAAAGASSISSK